jgi:adenylate kinase family enzyme
MKPNFEKIIILGSSCSGKTTLAKRLAKINHAKPIDLDDLNWLPGWKSRPTDEMIAKLENEIWGEKKWIISGNYRGTHAFTMPKATCVIWLDFRLRLVLWRMLKRTLQRIVTQEEICNGNRETIYGTFFDKENLFSYTIHTYAKRKEQFSNLGDVYPHLEIYRITSPKKLEKFVLFFKETVQVD